MLKPTPGTVLVEPLQKDSSAPTFSSSKSRTRMIQGTVLAVGDNTVTKFNAPIKQPCKVGDVVYFLSYEGQYDLFYHLSRPYYTVEFLDIRVVVEQ